MSIKDILLHLDDSPDCERRIDVAMLLAKSHAASLTGISFVTHNFYQPQHSHAEEDMAASKTLMESKAVGSGVTVAWRCVESTVVGVGQSEMLIRCSHSSDLVIVGQEKRRKSRNSDIVEHLVLGCGRPVLVVPSAGTFPKVGKRVLVAWKSGREAARAVHDAVPFLKLADQVTLLSVSSAEDEERDPWNGILEHLQQHGIHTKAELRPATSVSAADNLLNLACDGSYDLLVMGAFSAPSRRGAQLGPVAAQILREMTVPVLMSH